MEVVKIDYADYNLNLETKEQLKKAELCQKSIAKHRPFTGKMLATIKNFYRIDVTWSSSALEGNSLTISETKVLLEDGITVGGKPLKDTLEICGHGEAYDYIFTLLTRKGITLHEINNIHKLLMQKQVGDEAGKYKTMNNMITGSAFPTVPVKRVKSEMEKLEKWMMEMNGKVHPVQFAADAHRQLAYIHPYSDGNGRTARLVMNALLIQSGYLPCVISPAVRIDYINALETGRSGEKSEFIRVIAEAVTETEKDFIRYMDMQMPNFSNMEDFSER